MPHSHRVSTLEYALILLVVVVGVLTLFAALSPILSLIIDGFKLAGALLNGDVAAIGSLLPAAK